MKTKKRALLVIGADEPKHACVRCTESCRRPFGVPLEPESAHQILTSPGLRPLLVGVAPKVLASGWLPMVERDSRASCLFLDGEGSCAVWRELGEAGLPRACREYPFARVLDESNEVRLGIERGCSGTRGGRDGKTLEISESKVAPRLGLSSGKTLVPAEYGVMARVVENLLADGDVRDGLRWAFRYSEAVSAALESGADKMSALGLVPPRGESQRFSPRVLDGMIFRVAFGSFAEFGEVPFRAKPLGLLARLGFLLRSLGWALGFGKARIFGGAAVPRRSLGGVEGLFEGESGRRIAGFLREVVARRVLFTRQTYFAKALVELALALAILAFVARSRALVRKEQKTSIADVDEGIRVAESFLGAQLAGQTLPALEHLRLELLADEAAFGAFLASI